MDDSVESTGIYMDLPSDNLRVRDLDEGMPERIHIASFSGSQSAVIARGLERSYTHVCRKRVYIYI